MKMKRCIAFEVARFCVSTSLATESGTHSTLEVATFHAP